MDTTSSQEMSAFLLFTSLDNSRELVDCLLDSCVSNLPLVVPYFVLLLPRFTQVMS